MHDVTLLPLRLQRKIRLGDSQCWLWSAGRNAKGYGLFHWEGRMQAAHRVTYELLIGPIPAGAQLDHLCRYPGCVNPEHLEPVEAGENQRRAIAARGLRGVALANKGVRQTHCSRGHAMTPENTYEWRGKRRCRTCNRINKGLTPMPLARTHCSYGHEFTPENTYDWNGHRHCRACGRRRMREWRARHDGG